MKLYTVIGNNRGSQELVLSTSKSRAIDLTNIKEMGGARVEIYDKNPSSKIKVKDSEFIYHCDDTQRDFILHLDIVVDDILVQFDD